MSISTDCKNNKESGSKKVAPTDINRFTNEMAMRFVELAMVDGFSTGNCELLALCDAYENFKEQSHERL
ncbi:hypothetical protein NVP1049O_48 [Vibrio phage 1.049.O._10N.286.54.B5]|nr:hypothetical protein NVP1049O_48 [Vibrio phage 1.049.O._10N.286.54.B5]AUR84217.1 hypothetical protein NVP1050O_48 [Vibrio phage 1.050.O._10N.286.48.A6]